MRNSFIDTLCELAAEDPRIWLVCGDLGFSVLERFAQHFPDRYLNAGVAEQNMTGIAAGLASCGKIVFTYSIANFPVMRCLEQIRNDVCYHNLNVKVVAVGGGLAYASAGYSHHGVEDFAVLRSMPNMKLFAPGDPLETRAATRAVAEIDGPAYLRLGKNNEAHIHTREPRVTPGKSVRVRKGDDVTILTAGGALRFAMQASDELRAEGIQAGVVSMPCLWPLDEDAVLAALDTGGIITAEEHGIGGLASPVAEVIAGSGRATRFIPVRLEKQALSIAGSQDALAKEAGLSADHIVAAARRVVSCRPVAKTTAEVVSNLVS